MADAKPGLGGLRMRPGLLAVPAAALTAGAVVAILGTRAIPTQAAAVLLIGASLPVLLLMIVRPHAVVAIYLLVLPLLLPWGVVAGLNAGEVLTFAMLGWGLFSLWEASDRFGAAVRALGPIVWPLAALAVVSVVSLAVNGITVFDEIAAALLKMLAFALMAMLVHVHADTPGKARTLLYAILAGGALVGAYGVVQYLAGWGYSEIYDWNRASGTFEHWNQLGGFMVLLGMPTLALAVSSPGLVRRSVFAAVFVVEMAALLLSQTLGSVLALVVGGAISIVFVVRVGWTRLLGAVLLTGAIMTSVIATNEELRDKLVNVDERVMDRLRTYAVGAAMFRDRMWFGFGSEERVTEELWFGEADYGITIFGASSSVPHNSFIEMGVEKGVFGALLFAILIAGALVVVLRHRRTLHASPHSMLYDGLVVGILAFLVQNMTNSIILHARMGIIFFALIAIIDRMGRQVAAEAAD